MATPHRELDTLLSMVGRGGITLWPVPQWAADAACAQVDPELFYPEKGGSTRPAKRICGACPVREECLEWALAYRRHVCAKDDGVRRATRRFRCARCGLEAIYENAGATEARSWFNRHSCRKREEALLRSALAQQKLDLIDRTPKPCHHKQANHQHGTNACYVLDKCRCEPCCKARHAQDDWRRRQQAYGRYQKYVPADPVREHVRALMDAGMGLKRIVAVTGVSQGAMWKLMYGKRRPDGTQTPTRRVLRETAEKLYALDPAWNGPLPLADGAVLTADQSRRTHQQLQALVALGWSMSELGRRLGISHVRNAIPVIKGERAVTVATAKKAATLFEQLSMTLPPETNQRQRISASRARKFARDHGWVPPLELEADATLDVDETYDEAVVIRRMNGDRTVPTTAADREEIVRRLHARGLVDTEMHRVTGLAADTIANTRRRLGLPTNYETTRWEAS